LERKYGEQQKIRFSRILFLMRQSVGYRKRKKMCLMRPFAEMRYGNA
jgi:hypothetical protein